MIKHLATSFSVSMMCRLLDVSRSNYYARQRGSPSARQQSNDRLAEDIQAQYSIEKGRAGAPRIVEALRADNKRISRKRVAKIMQQLGLRAKAAKKFKATTNSNHNLPVAENLLAQNFEAERPDEKYVSDITYIWTDEGWLYLAVVMDLYSRLVIGWAMSERMTAKLVCDALMMAMFRRKNPTGVIIHSDRGSQYCSHEYQKQIKKHQLICSMSKKGDCYDNAVMESWNHSFKVEAIHGERFSTREDAKEQVFEYIEVYYNRQRRHSRLGYLSPVDFEDKNVA